MINLNGFQVLCSNLEPVLLCYKGRPASIRSKIWFRQLGKGGFSTEELKEIYEKADLRLFSFVVQEALLT